MNDQIENPIATNNNKKTYLHEWYEKNKEKRKEIYRENREERLAKAQIYRESNPEKILASKRAYYANNREKILTRNNEWIKANSQKRSAQRKMYYAINSEKFKIWGKINSEKIADNHRRRRALKRNVTIEHFSSLEIFNRDNWICQLCHKKVNKRLKWPHPLSASLDHIIPLSLNGTHERKNVQLAHLSCNLKAHTRGIKQLRLMG